MWEEARDHLGPRHAAPQGLLGVGQDLGLDSKNNGKSGKGIQAWVGCGQICILGRAPLLQCRGMGGAQVNARRPGRRLLHNPGER